MNTPQAYPKNHMQKKGKKQKQTSPAHTFATVNCARTFIHLFILPARRLVVDGPLLAGPAAVWFFPALRATESLRPRVAHSAPRSCPLLRKAHLPTRCMIHFSH